MREEATSFLGLSSLLGHRDQLSVCRPGEGLPGRRPVKCKVEVKSALESSGLSGRSTSLVFEAWREYFIPSLPLPPPSPRWDASPSQGYLQHIIGNFLSFASVSKRVFVRNNSFENVFHLQVSSFSCNSFSCERLSTRTRFETEMANPCVHNWSIIYTWTALSEVSCPRTDTTCPGSRLEKLSEYISCIAAFGVHCALFSLIEQVKEHLCTGFCVSSAINTPSEAPATETIATYQHNTEIATNLLTLHLQASAKLSQHFSTIYGNITTDWTRERKCIWHAEKDIMIWLIIPVKHITQAVVK